MAVRNLSASILSKADVDASLYVYNQAGVPVPTEETLRLINYLPSYMQDGPILRRIFEVLGRELQNAASAKEDVERQLSLDTATWGLSWWEQMVGIAVQTENDNYVMRRALVRASFSGSREESEFYFIRRIGELVEAALAAETGTLTPVHPVVYLKDPATNPYEISIEVPATLHAANPTTAPTAAQDDTNANPQIEAGTYQYVVTFVFASGETLGGPPSNSVTVDANSGIDLSNVPVSPAADCLARRIYRRSGVGSYYLCGTIADNTTSTFADSASQASLAAGDVELPTENTAGTLLRERLENLINRTKPAHLKHTLTGTSFRVDISRLDEDPL